MTEIEGTIERLVDARLDDNGGQSAGQWRKRERDSNLGAKNCSNSSDHFVMVIPLLAYFSEPVYIYIVVVSFTRNADWTHE